MGLIPRLRTIIGTPSRGFGDTIAKITKVIGIEPCDSCEWRRQKLNQLFPYQSATKLAWSTPRVEADPAWGAASGGFQVSSPPLNREIPPGGLSAAIVAQATGGWRGPDARSGPADAEGRRRHEREQDSRRGETASPSPSTGTSGSGTFACGLDVTDLIKDAIHATRASFHGWTSDQKHEACQALTSLRTGDYAWDIIQLHRQVDSDWINRGFRPACATSGADPACGSTVTVDGSCHFAGSANYVIFGVMCQLCFAYYDAMLKRASWYEVFDKDTYRQGKMSFSESGMLGLIDLYKKYVPLLKFDSPAKNIQAAKRWALAGRRGWPSGARTPDPDRANCVTTCPHNAIVRYRHFDVSWYPHLQPYGGR